MNPAQQYRDVDPATVVVACWPNGPYNPRSIWARRFIGIKVGENADGTICVQVSGLVSDFSQSVFRRGRQTVFRR